MKNLLFIFILFFIQYSAFAQILDANDFEVKETEKKYLRSEIIFKNKSFSFFSGINPTEVIGGYYGDKKRFVLFKQGAELFFHSADFYDNEWHSYASLALNSDISGIWQIQLTDIKILNDNSFRYNKTCAGICDHLINSPFFEEGVFYAKIIRPENRLSPQIKFQIRQPHLKVYSEDLFKVIEWF